MKRLVIGSIALLGLAGCNPSHNGYQATMPATPAPMVGVSSSPPDNPTGSQQYQSPDLERSHPIPGRRP